MSVFKLIFRIIATLAMVATALALTPLSASTASGDYKVTFVARQCDNYTDIMANQARNNIQESLQDLGKDSVYNSGEPVNPDIETANDPNCTPLVGWTFGVGTSINGKTNSLSTVEGEYDNPVAQSSTPLLDNEGNPTGENLEGAVTRDLTDDEVQASTIQDYVVQGGTAADPLNTAQFGDTYSFGTLRCAIDNKNADNVEYASFPSGDRHVFCYYYAVKRPAQPGTIIIRKELPAESTDSMTAQFHGNISYEPEGHLALDVTDGQAAQAEFTRAATAAGDQPWTMTEDSTPGWELTSLSCTSASGESSTTVTESSASIVLAESDTVTCTYVNEPTTTDEIGIYKRTIGGHGGPFHITARDPSSTEILSEEVSTTFNGQTLRVGSFGDTPEGTYTIEETLPSNGVGTWSATLRCNGQEIEATDSTSWQVEFAASATGVCLITNTFTPHGTLTIGKITEGGTGTATFTVTPLKDLQVHEWVTASPMSTTITTEDEGTEVSGDPLTELPEGEYIITELDTGHTEEGWSLTDISCDGTEKTHNHGSVAVSITAENPDVHCTFRNTKDTDETPAPTESSEPSGGAGDTTDEPHLPVTGISVWPMLAVAGGALLVGTGIYLAAQRRKNTA